MIILNSVAVVVGENKWSLSQYAKIWNIVEGKLNKLNIKHFFTFAGPVPKMLC